MKFHHVESENYSWISFFFFLLGEEKIRKEKNERDHPLSRVVGLTRAHNLGGCFDGEPNENVAMIDSFFVDYTPFPRNREKHCWLKLTFTRGTDIGAQ